MRSKRIGRACCVVAAIGLGLILDHYWTDLASALSSTFNARATLALCADYPFGGVTAELKYRVGTDPALHDLQIVSQNINSGTNTGTFDFQLPATFLKIPIAVSAYCRNSAGLSPASAEVTINNCAALALRDTDADGINDDQEDSNCDGFFSPGDASNLENVDTDGDGVRDLVEKASLTDPTNPGSSPRPYVLSAGMFDPDGNGESNPVVFRPSIGFWGIKDFPTAGTPLVFYFGRSGDIPFVYKREDGEHDVGVIRRDGTDYLWLFHGPGFEKTGQSDVTTLRFGIFGDNVVLGPWEEAEVTSPAVARLFNNSWTFDIYKKDGTIRHVAWGGNGDVPMVQDYDGDGLFDIAVFRPSLHKTYVIRSSDGVPVVYDFGSGTAEFTVRGDYDNDGIDDISFWESQVGLFSTLTSKNGFNDTLGRAKNPLYYQESSLGLYIVHLPLNWNRRGGRFLYTVVDHSNGNRFYRTDNNPNNPVLIESWGLAGDAMG